MHIKSKTLLSVLTLVLLPLKVDASGCNQNLEGPTDFTPLMEKKGEIYVDVKAQIRLDNETINAKGWKFRTRTITFSPGSVVPIHSHEDRPEMAMMKHGEVMIYESNCKEPYTMKEGDVYHSGKGDSHWAVNESSDYAVMYVTDLVRKESFPSK